MKKKLLSLLLVLSMCLSLLPGVALGETLEDPAGSAVIQEVPPEHSPADAGELIAAGDDSAQAEADETGETTPAAAAVGVVEIATAEDLAGIADGSYKLTANIDLSSGWESIESFSGTLDGDGHIVKLSGNPLFNTLAAGSRVVNLILDGTTTGKTVGTLAVSSSGTVQNCVSMAHVSVSSGYNNVGGFLFELKDGGTVSNCLYLGTIPESYLNSPYAIAAKMAKGSTLRDCYWAVEYLIGAAQGTGTKENCEQKTLADLKSSAFLALMDENRGDDGLTWGLNSEGLPLPGGDGEGVGLDTTALQLAVNSARDYTNDPVDPYDYTLWTKFKEALDRACDLLNDSSAVQSQLDEAAEALAWAQDALLKLDRVALAAKLAEAGAKKNPAEDGTKYTQVSWDALQTALSAGKALTEGVEVTQSKVDAATAELAEALNGLRIDLTDSVNRAALTAALEAAEKKNVLYTAASYAHFPGALDQARRVDADASSTQDAVTAAAGALSAATAALVERTFPGLEPPEGMYWESITTVEQFQSMETGKYYRLDQDLTLLIKKNNGFADVDVWEGIPLNAVLNGNGHVVKLGGVYSNNFSEAVYSTGVFTSIGESGVVYNLGVTGHVYPRYDMGSNASPLAQTCSGLVSNCYSWATVQMPSGSGGLVSTLESGGAIHNSYAAANQPGFGGGLAASAAGNSCLKNGYWWDRMSATSDGGTSKTTEELAGEDFRALLNGQKDDLECSWNQSDSGRPWHGPVQEYKPPVPISFTLTNSKGEILSNFDGTTTNLILSAMDGDDSGYVGHISYSRDPKAAFQLISGDAVSVLSNGRLVIEGAGTAVVGAYDPDVRDPLQWTYTKLLASFTVTVEQIELEDLRITVTPAIEGAEVRELDGVWTVDGSNGMICRVEGRLKGQEHYSNVSKYFDFITSDNLAVYTYGAYGDAVATPKTPGQGSVKAVSKKDSFSEEKAIEIKTNSIYVPVEGLSLPLPSTHTLHDRQAATTEAPGRFGYPHQGTLWPTATPANASYAPSLYYSKWTISSSDKTIAYYQESMVYNLVVEKAGTVTVTATLTDPGYGDVPAKMWTCEQEITFDYENPISAIRMKENSVVVKVGETKALPMTLVGTKEGYGLSMADMEWTTEGTGQVKFLHDPVVVKGRDDSDGINSFVANPEWQVLGTKVGTVQVTGTPVDQTNKVGSVTFTVNVTEGAEKPPVDHDALVSQGIAGAQRYITAKYEDKEYAYSSEWDAFAMSRSGGSLSTDQRNAYLDSAETWLKANLTDPSTKPTDIERVALAVGALGEVLSSFRGMDVVKELLKSEKISAGSNEAAYALLVLDSRAYPDSDGAVWSRDKLVNELIDRYQNPADGGFGLTDNTGTGVDTTAYILQALAPYYKSNDKVKTAVDKALDYLREKQQPDGGFGNVEAADQVLVALTALGLDPLDEANGFVQVTGDIITAIFAYYDEATGGFYHVIDPTVAPDGMATVQSLYALEAYRRFRNGESRLYDFAPVTARSTLEKRVAAAEQLKESDYTPASWTPFAAALKAAQELLRNAEATEEALSAADTVLANAAAALKKDGGGTNPPTPSNQITVTFRLIGSSLPSQDIDFNTHKGEYYGAEYQNWIKTTSYTLDKGATVYDLFTTALADAGLSQVGADDNYVKTIYAPEGYGGHALSEFSTGARSGWMYTIGSKHPDVGLQARRLQDNDEVVWHFVHDFSYEVSDWGDSHSPDKDYPSLGDSTTWDPWLKVKDTDPPKAGDSPSNGDGGSGNGQNHEIITVVKPEAVVDKNGEAKAEVSEKDVTGAIEDAKKNDAGSIVIEPAIKGDAGKVSVELPKTSVAAIAKETGAKLTVKTGIADVSIPNGALAELAKKSGKTVAISAETVKDKDGMATGEIRIELKTGDKAVENVKGGLSVSLPVEKATTGTVLVLVGSVGSETVIKKSVAGKDAVAALLDGSATVRVVDNSKTFADVPVDNWVTDAVNFAASHELFQGTGRDSFSAMAPMTRGMLATVLCRMENGGSAAESGLAWYAPGMAWAKEQGITDGSSPEASISRESLVVMLYRYAGEPKTADGALNVFGDADAVSDWAGDAMEWALQSGLITGKTGGALDPSGIATRAEMAVILQRFVTSLIELNLPVY